MNKKDVNTKKADVIKASTSTYFWLSYLQATSNCNIIAESSIKYPFVEFLERNGYEKIQLETHHPCFNTRYLDLFCGNVSDDNIAILDEDALLYIEFKFVRPDTRNGKEQQRIFDDLMRLFQVKKKHPDTLCYFMITGEATLYESCFKSIKKPSYTKSTIEEKLLMIQKTQ